MTDARPDAAHSAPRHDEGAMAAAARVAAFVVAMALGLCAIWLLSSGGREDFAAAGLDVNTTVRTTGLGA